PPRPPPVGRSAHRQRVAVTRRARSPGGIALHTVGVLMLAPEQGDDYSTLARLARRHSIQAFQTVRIPTTMRYHTQYKTILCWLGNTFSKCQSIRSVPVTNRTTTGIPWRLRCHQRICLNDRIAHASSFWSSL